MRCDDAHVRGELFEFARHPHGGAAERDLHAEFAEQMNIRARHAAVQNVAENGDVPAFELSLPVANRERVEQGLRGMLVRAVAGIENGNFEALGDEFRRAGRCVANDDSIGAHGLERANRVDERFALLQARGFGLQRHGVRAEPGGGGGEADARARGRLEKGDGDGLAAQRGKFFQRMALEFLEGLGLIENKSNLLAAEVFGSEQV